MTNAQGEATFDLHGGGCITNAMVGGGPVAQVFAGGVLLASIEVISPDLVDDNGNFPPQGPPCVFGLPDFVWLISNTSIAGGPGPMNECADYNRDGFVDQTDIILMTPFVQAFPGCQ